MKLGIESQLRVFISLFGVEGLLNTGKDTGMRGRQPTGLRDVFQDGGAGGTSIQDIDIGYDTPHRKIPGGF